MEKYLDKDFMVDVGSHYSGSTGYCIEAIKSKAHGVMLKLALSDEDMWFKLSEVKEF